MLSSKAEHIFDSDNARATATYSSSVLPATLAMIGRSGYLACNAGNFSSRTTFKPGFCRPIAFKTPDLVSAIRGVAFPACGVGACEGCVVPDKQGKLSLRVCVEGPVFNSQEVQLSV